MSTPSLPDGWRWESYGGVEVGVPSGWCWDNGSQRLEQWFVGRRPDLDVPVVGRPGVTTLVGYGGERGDIDPGTLVENTGSTVAFGSPGDLADGMEHEGDRTTVRLAGVEVCVQVAQPLRDRIVATIHGVGVDSHGCPTTHRVSVDPAARPDPAIDVSTLTGVTAVAVAKYVVDRGGNGRVPPLAASLRYDGAEAAAVIAAVARAEIGGGPNDPESGLPQYSYGDEMIVARVWFDAGESELYVRYSGCDHHGFDDGVNVRTLTVDALAPFIAGPNAVLGSVSGDMDALVWPGLS